MSPSSHSASQPQQIDTQYYSDFSSVPWARTLLDSAEYTTIPFTSRDPTYNFADKRTFACFRTTLFTASTVRAFVCLQRKPQSPTTTSPESPGPIPQPNNPQELLTLLSLGSPGLDGWPGILHGGIVALLLDEILGAIAESVLAVEVMTASMKVDFKKAVPTPGVVLGRARVERSEGKKAWICATLEDGCGGVFARGEGLFVRPRGRVLGGGEAKDTKL